MPRLSMSDTLPFFDETEQAALRLALPREPDGYATAPAVEVAAERRVRRLLAVCRHYTHACDAIAPEGHSS